MPDTPIADERCGVSMLYSSGTTGRPKGVRIPLPEDPDIAAPFLVSQLAQAAFGFTADSIYLSPAPLYHAAPLAWCSAVTRIGGTIVMMEKFEAVAALAAIEKYGITDSQWVPTHFVRMLKLPPEERGRYDVSSLKCAVHAAAPCPVPIKQAMIEWWGPVIAANIMREPKATASPSFQAKYWLTHKGSVGRAISGILHICGEDGEELAAREEGAVYF